jgi:hypothetical protein
MWCATCSRRRTPPGERVNELLFDTFGVSSAERQACAAPAGEQQHSTCAHASCGWHPRIGIDLKQAGCRYMVAAAAITAAGCCC